MESTTETMSPAVSRTVKIIGTRGENTVINNFTGTKWKELRTAIHKAGLSTEKMKCVEGRTKHTFEHDEAALPIADFRVFLMQIKSKSGNEEEGEKAPKKAAAKKSTAKKAVAKKAAPKKAATKKVTAKKAGATPKKAAAKKAAPKKVKATPAEAPPAGNIADVVGAVILDKEKTYANDYDELKELANGFSDVDRNRI